MKKRILMGLLFLAIAGTSSVFAQSNNSINMIEATFLHIEESIRKGELENWVKDLQKEAASSIIGNAARRDYVYFKIRGTKASKSAVINGLAGLVPGVWEIPADAATLAMNWTTQAQVAYAVACAYGNKPTPDSFQLDLVLLLAGEEMAKEAGKEIKSLNPTQLGQAGTINFKNNFNRDEQKKLITKITEKMYNDKKTGVAIAYAAEKVVGKLIGPAKAVTDALFAYMDITSMARAAQVYYYKFPMFSGRYISGTYGVALEFSTNGTVKVLPRLESADKGFIGDIRSQQQLGTGKYVIDKRSITITFGTVSWEKSPWNAKRPTSDTWKYVTVEEDLSNKTVFGNFDGEEVLEFLTIDTRSTIWERIDLETSPVIAQDQYKLAFSTRDQGYEVKQMNDKISGEVVIPALYAGKPVVAIAASAFDNNASITSVTIPENVAAIYRYSFRNCKGLTSVTIPASVTLIDQRAFEGCANLIYVTFKGKVASIEISGFPGDLSLKHKDGGAGTYMRQAGDTWERQGGSTWPGQPTLGKLTFAERDKGYEAKQGSDKISGEVVIPALYAGKSVVAIAASAFANNASITSVTIPENVAAIYRYSFMSCSGLTSVTIPASVTLIDQRAFDYCTNLNSVTFKGKVASIENNGFPGDLASKHKAGGAGTYTRQAGKNEWEKKN